MPIGVFESIFDNSEEAAEQERQRQELLRINKLLIEEQTRQLEQALRIAQQRSELLTKEVDIQLKLNQLTIKDPAARQQADIAALQGLATTRAEQAGLTGATPEAVAEQVKQLEGSRIIDAAVIDTFQQLESLIVPGNLQFTRSNLPVIRSITENLQQLLTDPEVSPQLKSLIEPKIPNILSLIDTAISEAGVLGSFGAFQQRQLEQFALDPRTAIKEFQAGEQLKLAQSSELLDLLIDIQGRQPKDTAAGVNLTQQRESSFINIGRGGVREAFGQFVAPTVNAAALDLPSGVGTVAAATQATKSFQERQADSLDDLINLARAQLRQLVEINEKTGSGTVISEGEIDNIIADTLDRINERQIAI